MANEVALSNKEELFIQHLMEGMAVTKAAEAAGFNPTYGYPLRKKLAKHIINEAENYLAVHSVSAAKKLVDAISDDFPNAVQVQAANSLLDRIGIIKKDSTPQTTIKANIFILPEKQASQLIIDHE